MDELIKRVKKGDMKSIDEIIRLFYDQIYCYVYKLTEDKEHSMDLTQEIFIKALNHIHSFKKGIFQSWLYTIAHNHVMNYFQSKQYKVQKREFELLDIFSNDCSTEDQLIHQESYFLLSKAIVSLKDKYQEVILLKYYQDLSTRDIAEYLNLNENTVKTHLKRGIQELKLILERDDYFV